MTREDAQTKGRRLVSEGRVTIPCQIARYTVVASTCLGNRSRLVALG